MEQQKERAALPRASHAARRTAPIALALGALVASLVATGPASAGGVRTTRKVVISTIQNSKLGKILISGRTLYTLASGKTPCLSLCVRIWPEVVLPSGVAKATAGAGVSAAKLNSMTRSGHVRQVTYAGKPLYFFSGDKAAGQVRGAGLRDTWGKWSVVVVKPPSKTRSVTSTTSAGGYGY